MHLVGPAFIPSPGVFWSASRTSNRSSSPFPSFPSLSLILPPLSRLSSTPRFFFFFFLLSFGPFFSRCPFLLPRFFFCRFAASSSDPSPSLYPSLSPRTCAPTKPTQPPNAAGSKRNYSYLPSALSDSRLFRGSCSLSCRHTILGTRGNQETTSLPGHQQPR